MKTHDQRIPFWISLMMASALLLAGVAPGLAADELPALRGKPALRHLQQVGLHDSLAAAIETARYRIEPTAPGNAGYEAANPAQDYWARFGPDAVQVSGQADTGAAWELGLRLTGYGYGDRPQSLKAGAMRLSGEKRIEREWLRPGGDPVLSEWYVNRPGGLEQGFTVASAPAGNRGDEPLSLWLKLAGPWRGETTADGRSVVLRNNGAIVRYEGLRAYDATGRELPARMRLAGKELQLAVETAGAAWPVTIDPTLVQEAKLVANDVDGNNELGSAVAIDGDTAVVGALRDDLANFDEGSAYVFVRSGMSWSQQAKLIASDAVADDRFGVAVAIDGDTVVIGSLSADPLLINEGAAYVFVRSGGTWSEQQKLIASDASTNNEFGSSVAIDGDTIVVGSWLDDIIGFDEGSAYVFVRSGGTWSEQQQLTASDGGNDDRFGFSVAIDGDTAVIGALYDDLVSSDEGSAYVFVRSGGTWSEQQKLTASDGGDRDEFGFSVAIDGDTAVIGAWADDLVESDQGSAYIFVRSGGTWSEQQKVTASNGGNGDRFGHAVAIDGDTAVIGAPFHNMDGFDEGLAYVFVRSGGTWSEQQQLTAGDASSDERFGFAVAFDGDTLIIGAPYDDGVITFDEGAAYIFVLAPPENAPPVCSGSSPSISKLWPPNHGMVQVAIQGVTDPDGDPVSINIDQIRQDEAIDGQGDGNTCPDGGGVGTSTAQVRAERSAQGNGRVYTISFTAEDSEGGSCQGSVKVCVPHDKKDNCVDGGPTVNSTMCSGSSSMSAPSSVPAHSHSGGHLHNSSDKLLGLLCFSHLPTLQCDILCDAGALLCLDL